MNQVREEVTFTAGKIYIKGKKHARGKKKRADYILYYKKNIPLAIIEAKDNNHLPGDGIQQGLNYASILDVPFVFSSNGDSFIFHDKTISKEIEIDINNFPSPYDLWSKYKKFKNIKTDHERAITQDYFVESSNYELRYYQQIAVNKSIENIVNNQKQRLLLVMATGTGKTQVAFQIIYRLWKSKQKKRILFLADRNFPH
jgi:type I restriction enzyme R subunit